ncbi:MAG TPA: hypothetical protein VG796_26445 [Verrucomicrobiales bacterium]|jgi:hypothetical protein|nr:hypothetical protein [Verrucomicrobiales bacterium]
MSRFFFGMAEYYAPAVLCELAAWHYSPTALHVVAAVLWVLATVAVPGYMSRFTSIKAKFSIQCAHCAACSM